MKRGLKALLVIALLFVFNFSVKAVTIEEATTSVNNAKVSTNDFLEKLNTWATNNKEAVVYLTTEEVIGNINSSNYGSTIDYLINKLTTGGYNASATSLSAIKNDLVTDLNSIKTNQKKVYNYLDENKEDKVAGNLDILHELKVFSNQIDNNTGILMSTLYNIYYNDLNNNIDTYSFQESINFVDNALKMSIKLLNAYTTDVANWQNIYNSYFSDDEERITDSNLYNKYLNRLDNAYTNFYNLIYSKFKTKLDAKVKEIDDENIGKVEHNNKIFAVINDLTDSKNSISNNFTSLSNLVKIDLILNKITEKKNAIINKLNSEIETVRTHLLDTVLIDVKKDSDRKYFNIDIDNKLLMFSGGILKSDDFKAKLKTDYSKFEFDNLYNGNVGTKSNISVYGGTMKLIEFTIVVKGDVEADGKISALDYVAIKNHIMESKKITDQFSKLAADCNSDNKITALDYIYIKNYIMNGGL